MKAIIVGATGLVGRGIVEKALGLKDFSEVRVFVRKTLNIVHPKLKETVIDFNSIDRWKNEIFGDVLFSALGTTKKSAGSMEAQYTVDFTYQQQFAKLAAENGVRTYILISSVNANPKSSFFYLKMKGELEEEVKKLPFKSITILRPGPLAGHREKIRMNEVFSVFILDKLTKLIHLPSLRPVQGIQVAKMAIEAALLNRSGFNVLGAKEILQNRIQ
jgi:uncharacterized protein YbjT (DUF2867 family)